MVLTAASCLCAGTLVLSLSCLCSSFVGTLEWMFLTHSLLYGIGSSLLYMASSLIIGEYFNKHHKYHVLATSILLCGYPVGEYAGSAPVGVRQFSATSYAWTLSRSEMT